MQDNGFTTVWRAARLAALAVSGTCVALSGWAGPADAPLSQEVGPAPDDAGDAGDAPHEVAETGRASYYSNAFQGRRTASGERYDMHAFTAAHRTLPFGSYVRVSNLSKTRSVIVRINDRGPFTKGRMIDLSFAAANELGLQQAGSANVMLEPVPRDVAQTATQERPARIMLHIARPARHHTKHVHTHRH